MPIRHTLTRQLIHTTLLLILSIPLHALELPAQQASLAFNFYSGDDLTIDSQRIIACAQLLDQYSLCASFQHDSVNDASIDFRYQETYKEDQDTATVNAAYLHENSLLELSFSKREESGYDANTLSFDVSQSFLSGLSTWHMGYSRGWDTLGKRDLDPPVIFRRHKWL